MAVPRSRSGLPKRNGSIETHLKLQTAFDAWLIDYSSVMLQTGIRPCLMTLDHRVEEAVQMLDCRGRNLLRPTELSKKLGVSRCQMNRLFVRELGMTLREYWERQRFASAQMFLNGSDLSVKETAFRLGFISPQHFSRWFRKRSGVSPTQLRKESVPMI